MLYTMVTKLVLVVLVDTSNSNNLTLYIITRTYQYLTNSTYPEIFITLVWKVKCLFRSLLFN